MFIFHFHTVCLRIMEVFDRKPIKFGIICATAFLATTVLLPPLFSFIVPEWIVFITVLSAWLPIGIIALLVYWKKLL